MCMCFGVFLSGGCGGSADTSSSGSSGNAIPNNDPDTYNTAAVLDGNWEVIDQKVIIDVDYQASGLNMYLVTASMQFTDTEITETRGLSTVTLHESWRAVRDDSSREFIGVVPVNLDNQVMSMVKSGADNWRCEMFDEYKTVMNIEILEYNIIRITEHRLALINDTNGIEYDNVMTFRKK